MNVTWILLAAPQAPETSIAFLKMSENIELFMIYLNIS